MERGWDNTHIRSNGHRWCGADSTGVKSCTWMTRDTHLQRKGSPFSLDAIIPTGVSPGYLNGTLHDECGELRHHKVHAFEAGLFEFEDLLFDNRLECQVRGEEPRSTKVMGSDCILLGGGRERQ